MFRSSTEILVESSCGEIYEIVVEFVHSIPWYVLVRVGGVEPIEEDI
jgi:hypothetical protein